MDAVHLYTVRIKAQPHKVIESVSRRSAALGLERFNQTHHPTTLWATMSLVWWGRVEAFLTHLAVKENVAASTQNQAFSALLFLYRQVLHQDLGSIDALRAKRPRRLPTVLTKEETLVLIGCLPGTHQLMAKLLYGSGLRLMDCLRLRVNDLDFERRAIIVRDGSGPGRTATFGEGYRCAPRLHYTRLG